MPCKPWVLYPEGHAALPRAAALFSQSSQRAYALTRVGVVQVHLVMQFCDRGTLQEAVAKGTFLDELGRPNMVSGHTAGPLAGLTSHLQRVGHPASPCCECRGSSTVSLYLGVCVGGLACWRLRTLGLVSYRFRVLHQVCLPGSRSKTVRAMRRETCILGGLLWVTDCTLTGACIVQPRMFKLSIPNMVV
jgi:hypothetical protein